MLEKYEVSGSFKKTNLIKGHNTEEEHRDKVKNSVELTESNRMFEYIDAEIKEEVEKGLLESKLGFTWKDENANILQEALTSVGYDEIKIWG